MLDEKFVLEHIDEISELRNFNEVYEYFVSHGIQVNAAEVMALKDSSNLVSIFETNSQVLTMQQLDCVAGGWTGQNTTNCLTAAGTGLISGAAFGAISGGPIGALIGALVGVITGAFNTAISALLGGDGGAGEAAKKQGLENFYLSNHNG